MMQAIRPDLLTAVDRVMTCNPAHLMMGMSIPTFWGGKAGADQLQKQLEERAGVPVTMGSSACVAALARFDSIKRIGILTPYQPVGDIQVARYFADHDYEVVKVQSLKRPSQVQIAHASAADIQAGLRALAAAGVDAIVQAGTDLAVVDIADEAERWLDVPIVAVNAATYWHALRSSGINDQLSGFGRLLAQH
jgi:maleate isomerase